MGLEDNRPSPTKYIKESFKKMSPEDKKKKKGIIELYTAVQSEGSRTGTPTIIIRTTGCTHRCFFGEGGWCDSWYTSIHPSKALYSFEDVEKIYADNPHIKEMMITGGSPTMWPNLINELTRFAKKNGIFTTIETEGSHFIKTDHPIDLISLSPKFSNSIPDVGALTPKGEEVDQKMVKQHNKFRLNKPAIKLTLGYHSDYHLKPVWDGEDEVILKEILDFIEDYKIPHDKVYFMPAGDTRKALIKSYQKVFDWVRDNGYRMTYRPHIIAFDDQREV